MKSTNSVPVVAERVQYFTYQGEWAGGHVAKGVKAPSASAYFAEGTSRPDFETYVTIQNPQDTDTNARLTYMRGDGTTAEQVVQVPAHSRQTVRPSDVLGVADDASCDFSTRVDSTNGAGLVVERPMYFKYKGMWAGGHCVAAAPEPSESEYFGEGTIRQGFAPYVCIQNPNDEPVRVRLTYSWGDGLVNSEEKSIPPNSRETVTVKDSPTARTITNYYQSLVEYFNTLLYYQSMGLVEICDAYNGKYMDPKSDTPSSQALDYIYGPFKEYIEEEFDEFYSCVESLIASWSYINTSNGLVPEAQSIIANADALYMENMNALLYQGSGDDKQFYGSFGHMFAWQSEMGPDGMPGVTLVGQGAGGFNPGDAENVWRPVRLKYYDGTQQKLVEDPASMGVTRYHSNCEAGSYQAGLRQGLVTTAGSAPTFAGMQALTVEEYSTTGAPTLPFGSITWLAQPRTGVVRKIDREPDSAMPPYLAARSPRCIQVSASDRFCVYLEPGSVPGCGSIRGWGNNSYGQLDFPGGDDYLQVSLGDAHGLALENDASLLGWGYNYFDQCDVPSGNVYAMVGAGDGCSLALKTDGSLTAWGLGVGGCPAGNDYAGIASTGNGWHALRVDPPVWSWRL